MKKIFLLLFVSIFSLSAISQIPTIRLDQIRGLVEKLDSLRSGSLSVSSISSLRSLSSALLSRAVVTDTSAGGSFVLRSTSDGFSVDSGIVIPSPTTGRVWVRDISQATALNVKWFGAVGDSVHDDTRAFKLARDLCLHSKFKNIFIPSGKYLITDTITFAFGVNITGESIDSTVLIRGFGSGFGSVGIFTFISSAFNKYITGIQVKNISFLGNSSVLGYNQFIHLLALHGTAGAVIDNCKFLEFRGDGLYVGAGLTSNPADVRKNKNITIRNCIFSGGRGSSYTNRNGLSVIDIDGANIYNNYFHHIGNDNLATSVGAIDFERNADSSFVRTINITDNVFDSVPTTNTAAITYHATNTGTFIDHANGLNIQRNRFNYCYYAVQVQSKTAYNSLDKEAVSTTISDNLFSYGVDAAVSFTCGRGVSVIHNTFKGSSTGQNHVVIGVPPANTHLAAQDAEVGWNTFDSCGATGVIEVGSVRGLNIHDNIFNNKKSAIYFYTDASLATGRLLDNIKIVNNRVQAPQNADNTAPNIYLVRVPAGVNTTNLLINSNCEISGNILGNRVSSYSTSSEFILNHSYISSIPQTGTWDAGNELYSTPSVNGSYKVLCIKSGTIGTLASTINLVATNNNNLLTYGAGNISYSQLREGQYITLTGSSKVFKIIGTRDSTGLYMDQSYDGSTGTVQCAWSAPTFVNEPINYLNTSITTTVSKTVGNISQFYEGNLTTARTLTISADTTTLQGTRIHAINKTTNGSSWTITPDVGVTFNGSSSSIILSQGSTLDLINTGVNQWKTYYLTGVGSSSSGTDTTKFVTKSISADVTNTTSTAADVGLSWDVVAGTSYELHIQMLTSSDNTGGISFTYSAPSATGVLSSFTGNSTSTTAVQKNFISASGGAVTGFNRYVGNGIVDIIAKFDITTTGTLKIQFYSAVATQTSTIKAKSWGTLSKLQ